MSKFKVGDKVRCLDNGQYYEHLLTVGRTYDVLEYDGKHLKVLSDNGEHTPEPYASRFELVSTSAYIINGDNYEYPTLEAAEAGVKAIGNNGVTYEIAQIVKRVTVKRETVVTLEETV